MKWNKYVGLVILLLCTLEALAQRDLELNEKFLFKDYCFDGKIKTILVYKDGDELSEPVIELGTKDALTVKFDDLSPGRALYYTIEHCDADWRPDNLFINDYMRGFPEIDLINFAYSINTQVPFLHYTFSIPNREAELITSGNFLLKVYAVSNPKLPLFQKGFSVVERQATLDASYESLSVPRQGGQQKLYFSIRHPKLWVQDPYKDFKVRICQNSQRVPSVPNPEPVFISNAFIDYTFPNRNVYNGGNEYVIFDIRNTEFAAQGVSRVNNIDGMCYALLNPAGIRANKPYVFYPDLNGKFLVDRDNKLRDQKHLEADYVYVYFTLAAKEPIPNSTVYVFGQLSDWSLYDTHAMVYNENRKAYELTLLLKQGFYSYEHAVVDNKANLDASIVEGSYWDTENDYDFYVYYRTVRDRWDKLVSYQQINTLKR